MLRAAVAAFGGQSRERLTREVTHLVTLAESGVRLSFDRIKRVRSSMDAQEKYEAAVKHGLKCGMKIILPHW
jgi:hypothetical protein